MSPRKRRRNPKRHKVRLDGKRKQGFHCAWCRRDAPYNERYVPDYYRAASEHQRDRWMCFACHLEGAGESFPRHGKAGRARPALTPETLEQFWREDVSDEPYFEAAMEYFQVDEETLQSVLERITI